MSKPNSQMVSVGKPHGNGGRVAGGAWYGKAGGALPTDATTTLASTFTDLGYLSDDGLTDTIDKNFTDVTAWGGDRVLSVLTSQTESFKFAMIETTLDTLKVVYGSDNVTDNSGVISVKHNAKGNEQFSFVFEIAMTGNRVKRIVVPSAVVTNLDDVEYKDGDAINYSIELAALPDSDGSTAYEYISAVSTTTPGSDH